jgi:hypothetical protein
MSISVHLLPDPIKMRGTTERQLRITFKNAAPGSVQLELSAGGSCRFGEGKTLVRSKQTVGAGEFHVTTSVTCNCAQPTSVVNTNIRATVTDSGGAKGSDSAPLRYACG